MHIVFGGVLFFRSFLFGAIVEHIFDRLQNYFPHQQANEIFCSGMQVISEERMDGWTPDRLEKGTLMICRFPSHFITIITSISMAIILSSGFTG